MRIAIHGPGSIGSTFAFHLSRAGHDVCVIARTTRLAQLEADRAILTTSGLRAPITPLPALAPDDVFDLVLVTVLASQVDAVLPALTANASKRVMFMFNAFNGLPALRDAVGRERFAWGFPAVIASLVDGKLASQVVPRAMAALQITTVGGLADFAPPGLDDLARTFSAAGIPTVVHPDMESWLRTHAAFMVPLMLSGVRPLAWTEARALALRMKEGFALVRRLGQRVTPFGMGVMAGLPRVVINCLLWVISRSQAGKALGAGEVEARWLGEEMKKSGPSPWPSPRTRGEGIA